jgi:GT2 family glycosyltransferase
MIDISVSIANFNQCAFLDRCLRSILNTSQGLNLEIFVVDNASYDGSIEIIKDKFPEVILIANSQNRGYAAANNQVIRVSNSRYVLILNNDVIVKPGALQKMVAFMNEHPRLGMLGPRVLNPDGTLQHSCSNLPSFHSLMCRALYFDKLFPRNRLTGTLFMSYWKHDYIREVGMISGCCMLVRRETIRQVGLMDEQFFFYAEEADWCYRIKESGWKICFLPDAQVIHYGGQSTSCCATEEIYIQHFRSRLQYFKKHYGLLGVVFAKIILVFHVVMRLCYHWFSRVFLSRQKREYADYKLGLYWSALHWLLNGCPFWRIEGQ